LAPRRSRPLGRSSRKDAKVIAEAGPSTISGRGGLGTKFVGGAIRD
jgi:hypothetical protein